jgi:alkylhydroperoxidase family enzyme
VWQAVVDRRPSPRLRPEVTAALELVEKLALHPETLAASDIEAAREAGLSDDALEDVVVVCGLFTMIVRLADSLGWDIPEWEALQLRAPAMLADGYSLAAIERR